MAATLPSATELPISTLLELMSVLGSMACGCSVAGFTICLTVGVLAFGLALGLAFGLGC